MDFATPAVFANARADPDEIGGTGGLTCELKLYEAHYNSKGERIALRAGAKRTEKQPRERDHDSALVLTKYYKKDKELEYRQLEVRSPHIRKALRTAIKSYPGMTFETGKIIIRNDLRCLFHFRNELREYGLYLQDETAAQHLEFILNYMYTTLESEISAYYTFMESPSCAPGIDFRWLWMAFRPGDLIYHKFDGIESLLRFRTMSEAVGIWFLDTDEIQSDGTNYGYSAVQVRIRRYTGYKPLEELTAFPLKYCSRKDDIVDSLLARGKKFLGLQGIHHRYYEGVAESLSPSRKVSIDGEEDEYCTETITVKSRIIVDCAKFGEVRPTHKYYIPETWRIKTEPGQQPELSHEDLLICSHAIYGFSLANKRWCYFELDRIKEFEYNSRAFESLLLAEDQKEMIHSLVKVHSDKRLQFDDLIKGKGKGMVFLLHGEPGVGKTLTAESVADYTKRPLYTVTSGDLGTNAETVERCLLDSLGLAAHWNAIVLIDEADIFLEQRSHHDLERNGLVSVFLRLLEYYEGLMILTTNRVSAFDTAFKSRIHLAIKYPALSFESRRKLWTTFITSGDTHPWPFWMDDSFLDSLAAENLNGRQIKNVVRMANALAIAEGGDLRPKNIRMSLKSIKDFEEDFAAEDTTETAGHGGSPTSEHRAKRQRRG